MCPIQDWLILCCNNLTLCVTLDEDTNLNSLKVLGHDVIFEHQDLLCECRNKKHSLCSCTPAEGATGSSVLCNGCQLNTEILG